MSSTKLHPLQTNAKACFACDRQPQDGRDKQLIKYAVSQEHHILLCEGRSHSEPFFGMGTRRDPLVGCKRKALAALTPEMCFACGAMYDYREVKPTKALICQGCADKLARQTEVDSTSEWCFLDPHAIEAHIGWSWGSETAKDFCKAFLVAISGEAVPVNYDSVHRERIKLIEYKEPNTAFKGYEGRVSHEQSEAAQRVMKLIDAMLKRARSAGQNDGTSMLSNLADGRMTVHDFADRKDKLRSQLAAADEAIDEAEGDLEDFDDDDEECGP
jgi:hypothetical protein